MDSSIPIAVITVAVSEVSVELIRQNRIAGRLEGTSADQWDYLGRMERYQVQRSLRRGRALEDSRYAGMGADVAALLQVEHGRPWAAWLLCLLGLVFLAIGIVAVGDAHIARGVIALVAGAGMFALVASFRLTARRLARAERANRALLET